MTSAMDQMFDQMQTMPSIPKALQAVMDSLSKEDASINDIVEPLALDPILSSKVLRMSNAAHYGLQRQVATVDDAVRLVGFNAVRTMVLSSGLMSTFEDVPGLDLKLFWRKTLIASIIARDLAPSLNLNPEEAYTAALMHGIGILSMHQVFPEVVKNVLADCENDSPRVRVKSERKQLGFTHCQVGRTITRWWNIPDQIGNAILCYAYPTNTAGSELAALVHVAVVMAADLENGVEADEFGNLLSEDVLELASLDRTDPRLQAEHWEEVVASIRDLVS